MDLVFLYDAMGKQCAHRSVRGAQCCASPPAQCLLVSTRKTGAPPCALHLVSLSGHLKQSAAYVDGQLQGLVQPAEQRAETPTGAHAGRAHDFAADAASHPARTAALQVRRDFNCAVKLVRQQCKPRPETHCPRVFHCRSVGSARRPTAIQRGQRR